MIKEIDIKELVLNPVTAFSSDWMLLTAGTEDRGYNCMTCSWGHIGNIWTGATAICYVRPRRYTKEFIDREELYTLCSFNGCKKELAYLGSRSGRDEDKVSKVGLTPVFGDGYTYYAEAELVLVCRKLYRAPITEACFTDHSVVEKCYPERDFHDMYIGEIVKALKA